MNQRWTLALLAIAAALAAWVWFGEIKGDERKQAADAATKQFFAIAPKDVTALELSLGGGATAKLARSGERTGSSSRRSRIRPTPRRWSARSRTSRSSPTP